MPRRSFTYVGQPFGFAVRPTATILPRNAAGALTVNYRGPLWKITSDHIVRQLTANDTLPAGQPVLVTIGGVAPADVVSNGDGTGRVTTSALDAIQYTRNAATPQAPFTARITTAIWISDSTEGGVAGNPATIGSALTRACFNGGGTCAVPGAGIAFDSAVSGFPGNEFRYGRLRLANANGSELIALPAPALAEYWNGSAWVSNARDFCTTIDAGRVTLSNWQRNLQEGETRVASAGTMYEGRRSIVFLAPGAGNSGSVDLAIDLVAAGLPWLQGAWTGGSHDRNPSARMTFGTASAPSPMIFRRERY
jgi:MSHA biogenesis protein MshQ